MEVFRWLLFLAFMVLVLGFLAKSKLEDFKLDQPQMFSEPVVDQFAPALPESIIARQSAANILVFSKTHGYRHHDAIIAANAMFTSIAKQQDWSLVHTENAAIFASELLAYFDVVVWNNATGPLLTSQQRQAFKEFLEQGGGFVGIHAAGDASHSDWQWYQQQVIRANFTGHPMFPQFQSAVLSFEKNSHHPAIRHFNRSMNHIDEWYCFEHSPRDKVNVLAVIDEQGMNFMALNSRDKLSFGNLAMGDDHPVIWSHQQGSGRVFYSALGHKAESYQVPDFITMHEQAVIWAGRLQ